jgi:hypothetical protein
MELFWAKINYICDKIYNFIIVNDNTEQLNDEI